MTSAPTPASNRAPLQVLYLDYDGVLHHDAVYRSPKRGIYLDSSAAPGRRLFEWTDYLVQAVQPYPEIKIVLSTSWVRVLGYSGARRYLPPSLAARVIGATFHRRHHRSDYVSAKSKHWPTRGSEVMRDVARRCPDEWIAIDDTDNGWPVEHRDRVVLCDPTSGLSDADTRARLQAALTKYFSSDTELIPLTPQQHVEIAKAAPWIEGAVVSSLLDTCKSSASDSEFIAALTKVTQRGLAGAGQAVIEATANGVWHSHHVPQECVLQGPYEVEAALLIERLAFYAIVPQPRKKALLSLVRLLLPAEGSASRTSFNTEFQRYLPALQPLQTRHARPS